MKNEFLREIFAPFNVSELPELRFDFLFFSNTEKSILDNGLSPGVTYLDGI